MLLNYPPLDRDPAVAEEQIKALFKETNDQNLAGAVVLTLIIWVAKDAVPMWTWAPALIGVYLSTASRSFLIWQHGRWPAMRNSMQWAMGQTVTSAIGALGWGFANTSICMHAPLRYQLFVATVSSVSASASASAGFAYMAPAFVFVCISLIPVTLWFYSGNDELHLVLAVLLTIYIPMVLWQAIKRHHVFVGALKLRFSNEALAIELAKQRKIAEDAGLAKSRFLAVASHDLRQPVQALVIFQELLRSEVSLSSKGEEYFMRAQQSVHSVSSLLDSLLDISKLDSNAVRSVPEFVPLGPLLAAILQEFKPIAEQKGLRLHVVKSSACLYTDPQLLGQVLRNLTANALRYTPSGKVLVGCRRRGEQLSIEVWDTGIGIAPEHQQLIFGEFFQVGNEHRDRQKGMGLGLAIVDRVVKLLGAKLELRSKVGHGSCFSIALPLFSVAWAEGASAPPEAADTSASLQGRHVIIIENEETIRLALHALLENWGCQVISGASGIGVLDQLSEPNMEVDAIVSDLGLPGGESGIDVVRRLRGLLGAQVPALLVTGDTSQQAMFAAHAAGLPIVHKPIDPQQLRRRLVILLTQPLAAAA